MWLYPVPSVVALVGWLVIYGYADRNAPGRHPIEWSLAWVGAGCVAFLLWARFEKVWPFGPKEISEGISEEIGEETSEASGEVGEEISEETSEEVGGETSEGISEESLRGADPDAGGAPVPPSAR